MDSSEQGDGLLNHAFWLYRRQHPGVLTEPAVLPDLHRPVECVHDALHDCVSPALLGARRFSLPIMWVSGIHLRLSDLAAGAH